MDRGVDGNMADYGSDGGADDGVKAGMAGLGCEGK